MSRAGEGGRPGLEAPLWPAIGRIVFGTVLIIDAWLEWQPGAYQSFASLIFTNGAASHSPVAQALSFGAGLVARQPSLANGLLAALETILGASILLGVGASVSLLAGIPLYLAIWLFGEGLGLPFAPGSTDLGPGILYAICSALLWVSSSWERLSLAAWVRAGAHQPRKKLWVICSLVVGLGVLAAGTWGSVDASEGAPGVAAPPAVGGASLAFDPRINSDLLFGGCGQLTCSARTWLWDGSRWSVRGSRSSPGAIGYSSSAYSASSDSVVLFGGAALQGTSPPSAASWLWRGYWSQISSRAHPSARRFAALGYDPETGQAILFGGDTAEAVPLGDTWSLRHGRWTRLRTKVAPTPRAAAAMAWDPKNHELILFGGSNRAGRLGGTWAWTGSDWVHLHPAESPPPLAYEAMATDPLSSTALLYAGSGSARSTWEWTGSDWRALKTQESPPAFSFVTMAAAPDHRGVLLFGGAANTSQGFSDQTWLWSKVGWTRVSGSGSR